MGKYNVIFNRKDNFVVTICKVKNWRHLYNLYRLYIEENGYKKVAAKDFGFIASNGIEKIICYNTERKDGK